MSVFVELKKEHLEFADDLARRRQHAAVERRRQAHNGASDDPDQALAYHLSGTRCECAAYLWMKPVKWHTFADNVNGLPDLDDFIDVKGRTKSWHQLIVQKDDPPEWAYLEVLSHNHPVYEICGWAWGHEAKIPENWKDPAGGRPAYFLRAPYDPESLLEILRFSQGVKEAWGLSSVVPASVNAR